MIIKNTKQLEKIQFAGYVNAFTLEVLKEFTLNNFSRINAKILDDLAFKIITSLGCKPSFKDYKPPFSNVKYEYSITVSINEEIVHGLPRENKLFKEGDVVSLDCGTFYDGYHVDSAITFVIGGTRKIVDVCENSLYLAIENIKHNVYIRDVSKVLEDYVVSNGFFVIKELTGHGVGRTLHDDPEIPNFYIPGFSKKFYNNMLVAIEPMISEGSEDIRILDDHWTIVTKDGSIASHFEHTILVEQNQSKIITKIPPDVFKEFYDKIKHLIKVLEAT